MTVDEINAKILEFSTAIKELERISKDTDVETVVRLFDNKIQDFKQEIERLKIELETTKQAKKQQRLNEKAQELQDLIDYFLGESDWTDENQKETFMENCSVSFDEIQKKLLVKLLTSTGNLPTTAKAKVKLIETTANSSNNKLIKSTTKSKHKKLRITFSETNEIISERKAAETLVEAIFLLGVERVIEVVEKLKITVGSEYLVSRQKPSATTSSGIYAFQERDGYFIMSHSSTKEKKNQLERIAKELGVPVKVEIIPK